MTIGLNHEINNMAEEMLFDNRSSEYIRSEFEGVISMIRKEDHVPVKKQTPITQKMKLYFEIILANSYL